MNNNSKLISISKKSFFSVVIILFLLMIGASVLTHNILQGEFEREGDMIINGTFHYIIQEGGFPYLRIIFAPFEVLKSSDGLSIIVISIFILVLGGTFTLMDKTGGIKVILKRLINKYQSKKYTLLRIIILVFMMFGAFFGIFEESIALIPIMILLSLSFGWDTLVGLGMTMLAAGFGFASAITNPFSVGIASDLAGTNILSGVWYRLIVFSVLYLILSTFIVKYAKKIEKDSTKSITYTDDIKKVKSFDISDSITLEKEKLIYKSYIWMFIIFFFSIVIISVIDLVSAISLPTIPVMAIIFLVGGLSSGLIVTKNIMYTLKSYLNGMISVAPAVLLIMMAASVKYIIVEGKIMDTILYYLSNLLSSQGAVVGILLIYALVLITDFFIGSASAKAYLIIPLLIPLASLVGYSKELAILAFVFGDGYTNVIFPTSAVMLVGLSIAGVSYGKWFKWSGLLQLSILLITAIMLIIALLIGY